MKTKADEINSRGHANGWYAQELQKEALRTGQDMASLFRGKSKHMAGFNVPAKCVKVSAAWIDYEFSDGSKDHYPNPNYGK